MADEYPQRRELVVPIPGPAPANGASFVQFTALAPGTWTSQDIGVGHCAELAVEFAVATISAGSAQLLIDRKEADGSYSNIATAVAKTGAARDDVSLGSGFPTSAAFGVAAAEAAWSVGEAFGDILRLRVVVVTGNLTGTLSVKGKTG